MLSVEILGTGSKSSPLTVDRKYQKRQSRNNCIILLCNPKYKRRWLYVLFKDKHNINAVF